MKLKFYLKTALFAFCAATHCFASVNAAVDTNRTALDAENARVLAGIQYITQQDTTRCAGFNEQPVETMRNSPETNSIINLLSNKTKVSAKEATIDQKQVIATSVMGTIIVHGVKKLTPHGLTNRDANFRHFRALELIEDLSFELNGKLIDQDGVMVVDHAWLSDNWATYSDLETYSKITADMFELWFNEALEKHKPGFVKLAEIKQKEHDIQLAKHARIELEKAEKAEEERLRLKKIEEAKEAELELDRNKRVAAVLSSVLPPDVETTAEPSTQPSTLKNLTDTTLVTPEKVATLAEILGSPNGDAIEEVLRGETGDSAGATGTLNNAPSTPIIYKGNADKTPPGTPLERITKNAKSALTSPAVLANAGMVGLAMFAGLLNG